VKPPADPFDPPLLFALGRGFCRIVLEDLFAFRARGAGHVPRSGGCLLVANHASFLDPPAVICGAGRCGYSFARKTLYRPRLFGWLLRRFLTIPVDRDGGNDLSALREVLRLLADGQCVLVFPEGTRSAGGSLQQARRGVGMLAAKAAVPVVPARVFGSYEAWNRGEKWPRWFHPVRVVYGPPLLPEHYDPGTSHPARYQCIADLFLRCIAVLSPNA
jgi:1-acyl-sn-glycerol-3-phosphate acyltransferase